MIEAIIISLITGTIIGGCFVLVLALLYFSIKPEIFEESALKWHTYWTKYHQRILYQLAEDGGTFDQYYTDEFKYHMAKFEYHSRKMESNHNA